MRNLFIIAASILLVITYLCGCGNEAKTTDEINITEDMYITYISNIYENPADYIGKSIKIEGMFAEDVHDNHVHYYVYRNALVYSHNQGYNHEEKLGL